MMALLPVVRHMILCQDWEVERARERLINVRGLLTSIRSLDSPPYPLLYREICVLVVATDGRGQGMAQITCRFENSGDILFSTRPRQLRFGRDPLRVYAFGFRIGNCPFPDPGIYTFQFVYNEVVLANCPLRLR